MQHSWDIVVSILVVFGLLFFGVAVWALSWAAKNRQFERFEQGARVIFDDEEPEGVCTDSFPRASKKSKKRRANKSDQKPVDGSD